MNKDLWRCGVFLGKRQESASPKVEETNKEARGE